MDMFWADNCQKLTKVVISNPKPELHNINAHTKFSENPLMFTQVIIWKRNADGPTYERRADRHTDVQCETIIPCHYCVAGYNDRNMAGISIPLNACCLLLSDSSHLLPN